ncbi:hypothetical protein ACUXEV_001230 [Staphylococcus saprophyticus]
MPNNDDAINGSNQMLGVNANNTLAHANAITPKLNAK